MRDPDKGNQEVTLKNLEQICKGINLILVVLLVLLSLYLVPALFSMLMSSIDAKNTTSGDNLSLLSMFLYFAHGLTIIALLAVFIRIFKSAAKGESPFTMVQVKRLRIVAALMLIYALVDSAVSWNNAIVQYASMNYGYVSTSDSAIVAINFSPVAASAIVFAFSFVFKYGVLLQEFSDETL